MLFPTLGPSSLPVIVAQLNEKHAKLQTEQLLCWSATFGSNEEAETHAAVREEALSKI